MLRLCGVHAPTHARSITRYRLARLAFRAGGVDIECVQWWSGVRGTPLSARRTAVSLGARRSSAEAEAGREVG